MKRSAWIGTGGLRERFWPLLLSQNISLIISHLASFTTATTVRKAAPWIFQGFPVHWPIIWRNIGHKKTRSQDEIDMALWQGIKPHPILLLHHVWMPFFLQDGKGASLSNSQISNGLDGPKPVLFAQSYFLRLGASSKTKQKKTEPSSRSYRSYWCQQSAPPGEGEGTLSQLYFESCQIPDSPMSGLELWVAFSFLLVCFYFSWSESNRDRGTRDFKCSEQINTTIKL